MSPTPPPRAPSGRPSPWVRFVRRRLWRFRPFVAAYERLWRPPAVWLVARIGLDTEVEVLRTLGFLRPGTRLLDVACGPGNVTRPLAAAAAPGGAVGLDRSHAMLLEARGREGARYVEADAHRLPFAAGAFDVVNCSGALHLFDDPGSVLREIHRVLAPGGRFTGMTFLRGMRWLDRLGPGVGVRTFAREELAALFTAHGFAPPDLRPFRTMVLFGATRV